MSRPVGARIISICELLEFHGAMNRRQVFDLMVGVDVQNVHQYLHRAVGLRLLAINRSQRPAMFEVLPGWKDRLGGAVYVAQELKPKPAPALKLKPQPKTHFQPKFLVSSVWDMGMAA